MKFWQAINDHAAVQWDTEKSGAQGFVTWGQVRSADLHTIRIMELIAPRHDQPAWEQDHPPTQDEIKRRYDEPHFMLLRAQSVDCPRQTAVSFDKRKRGESTMEFYQRVAAFYTEQIVDGGKPTQALMVAASISPATARRWVWEARCRGFLSPTVAGRASL